MALGVTTCSASVYEAFLSEEAIKTFFHGHSFTANPVACSAALASLDLLLLPDCSDHRRRIAALHEQFRLTLAQHPGIKTCRQLGTVLAVEFQTGPTSYFNQVRNKLYAYAMENRIILRPLGNIIYVMPPYCTTNEQLQQIYDVILGMLTIIPAN